MILSGLKTQHNPNFTNMQILYSCYRQGKVGLTFKKWVCLVKCYYGKFMLNVLEKMFLNLKYFVMVCFLK